MTKHTPGPWTAFTDKNEKVWLVMPATIAVDKEADARLIAAAPELLDMCQMMRDEFGNEDGVFFGRHPAIGRLIDIIAKATGEA